MKNKGKKKGRRVAVAMGMGIFAGAAAITKCIYLTAGIPSKIVVNMGEK